MPVLEGLLLDKHNSILMDLLFILAHWHALAKLRQHTDLSLAVLESVTIQLSQSLRQFQLQTCPVYDTKELKREEAARIRRAAGTPNASMLEKPSARPKMEIGKKGKTLNLNTYKFHSLGDYVETIKRYGTTDSYSTESVSPSPFLLFLILILLCLQMELEHRSPKSCYLRTSHKDFEKQLN